MYPNLDFWFENKPSGNPDHSNKKHDENRVLIHNFLEQILRQFVRQRPENMHGLDSISQRHIHMTTLCNRI
jgi:hypothetical protein